MGTAGALLVWAAFVRRGPAAPWRLEAISVLGADRARALAEREHTRDGVTGAEFRVLAYTSPREVPERLD